LSPIEAELSNLPPVFKILITSRPEYQIRRSLDSMGSSVRELPLSHDGDVDNDIYAFIKSRMASIAADFGLDRDWPGDVKRGVLVEKSNGLFIWASTAVKFIADPDIENPTRQLQRLLNGSTAAGPGNSPWVDLDMLYLQVLQQALP
jgi:hypothetical protein